MADRLETIVAPYDERRHSEVVDVMTRAFADDPLYRWLWPDACRRARGLSGFINGEVTIAAAAGRVDIAVDGSGRLLGAALWALPGRYPFPLRTGAVAMARAMPRMGFSATRRLPRFMRVERAHPKESHWYLVAIGITPEAQRRGVGATLISSGTARADRESIPVYLETFNPDNPAYYRRFGFVDREMVDEGRLPPFWTMLRPAASGTS